MSRVMAMQAAAKPSDSKHISADLPCTSCGYNLNTLSATGACPECGQPIKTTLRFCGDGVRLDYLDTLLYISNWLAWVPLIALMVSIPTTTIDYLSGRFSLTGIAACPLVILGVVYFLASCSYVGIAASYSGRRVSYVRHTMAALAFAVVVFYGAAQGIVSIFVAAMAGLPVCLIAWTTHHARHVAGAAPQPSLARLARATGFVAEATVVIIALVIFWPLARSLAYPEADSAQPKDILIDGISLLSLVCSSVLHIVLMFRLKRFLSRAKPVAAYLLATSISDR